MRHATLTGHPFSFRILEELDIALHYDITDKMWDGECVTLEADAAVAPIGNDVDAAAMDLEQMLARQ